jgi:hypothetical protein
MPLSRENKIEQPDSNKTSVEINIVNQPMPSLRDNKIQQLDSNKILVKISTIH